MLQDQEFADFKFVMKHFKNPVPLLRLNLLIFDNFFPQYYETSEVQCLAYALIVLPAGHSISSA